MSGFDSGINGDSRIGQGLQRNSSASESNYFSEFAFCSQPRLLYSGAAQKTIPRCTGKWPTNQLCNARTFPGKSAARHCPATLCTLAANPGAIFHAIQLLAALGTGVTNLGADCTGLVTKLGAAQHEV